MERRVTSHTEEEEMNQRRRLLTLARKGEQKSIDLLFELYQVKVFSGDALKKKKLPSFPVLKPSIGLGKTGSKASKNKGKTPKGSLSDSKVKKGQMGKSKTASKESQKLRSKEKTTKPVLQKITKVTRPSLKKKSVAKKASPPKRKFVGEKSKQQKLGLTKKSRIAKKK